MSRRGSLTSLFVAGLLVAGGPAPASLRAAEEPPAHDAVTPAPRDGDWHKRHEHISAQAAAGDIELVFLGDSITEGWADNDTWKKHYTSRRALNAGIGGDRTQHVLWRLEHGNVDGITPKLVVLMIGTNNASSNTSEQIAEGVAAIVAKLRMKLPETNLLVLGVFPRGETADDPLRVVNRGVNERIAKLADEKSRVYYLDISESFLSADGVLSREIMPDLLHLSPRGYELWAEAIEPTVARLMGGG